MRFSKSVSALLLLNLLSACSSFDTITEVFQRAPEPVVSEAPVEQTTITEPVALENPSLAQQALVSEETRQQYQAAIQLLEQQKLSQARAAFEALHAAHPDYSGPLVNLGIIAETENDQQSALDYYARAIAANPTNQQAYNRQGLLLRKQGNFDAAESSYLAAIKQWPSYAPVRLNLGILYDVYMGRLVDAAEQYQAYQDLQESPDRKVKAWQADLGRRVQAMLEQDQ
jgi:tetratricopeptide (TPR) repeat protein